MSNLISELCRQDVNLSPYNTLGVEAKAKRFISIRTEEQIQEIANDARLQKLPHCILGGGSNVLFVDDYEGLVLHVAITGREIIREDDQHVWLKIGAGENWHETVLFCVERGWGGVENLSLIPGTAGAAPIQNIGAYGVELVDVFSSLEALSLQSGHKKIFTSEECKFGYRNSIFKNELRGKYIVTRVTLRLDKKPQLNTSYGAIQSRLDDKGIANPTLKDISDIVIEIRSSKLPDPKALGNAGSFFKNPIISAEKFAEMKEDHPHIPGYPQGDDRVKVPAGWLIEQAGWKGKVIGHAGTYKQQALVIVNHGGATGREILSLSQKIRASVAKMFDIELAPEVNIIS